MEAMQGSRRGLACAAGATPFGQMDRAFAGAGVDLHVRGGVAVYPQSFSGHRQPKRSLFGAVHSDEDIMNNSIRDAKYRTKGIDAMAPWSWKGEQSRKDGLDVVGST